MNDRTNLNILLTIIAISLGMACTALAGTIFVDDDGPADFNNIQAAINNSNNNDTIVVADGTYTGNGNWDINFLGKIITVRSTDPNDPQIVETAIIDCNDPKGGTHYGVIFNSGETAQTVLSGLSITNSAGAIFCENDSSPTIRSCNFYGDNGSYVIICAAGSPAIDKCVIQGNLSGGGVLCGWQSTGPSSGYISQPTIIESSIYGNSGNGMEIVKGSPTVINTSITANGHYGVDG